MKKPKTKPAAKGLRRPRTEKQLALAEVRYQDDKKLEKRFGARFRDKALARLEKLIPDASKLGYTEIFMVTYTLAVCIDNRRNNRRATEAIGRAHDKDLTEMRKLRLIESGKKGARA